LTVVQLVKISGKEYFGSAGLVHEEYIA
jgi:hypothetical protein